MDHEVVNPPDTMERRKHRLEILYRQIDELTRPIHDAGGGGGPISL